MPWDKRMNWERPARVQFVLSRTHQQFEYWYTHWMQRSRPTAKDHKGYRMWKLQGGTPDLLRHTAKHLQHFTDLQGYHFTEDGYDIVYTGQSVPMNHWTYDDYSFEELLFQVQLHELATKTPRIHQE